MVSSIPLTATDGHDFHAYVAKPGGAPIAGLVVVQEIFGVNDHIRAVADGFAADGFLAAAPALFDRIEPGIELGYAPPDIERGRALRGQVANETALQDIQATITHLAGIVDRVGVVGYCWGGLLSWLSACRLEGLGASVCYYGGGVPDHADATPRCPVMLHFGRNDQQIPIDGVERFRTRHPDLPVHLYDAGHGFNCDHRGSYDAESAALARARTVAFFNAHL